MDVLEVLKVSSRSVPNSVAGAIAGGGKAKAVGPYHRTGMDDAVTANLYTFVYLHSSIDDGAIADLAVVADACIGVYFHVVANHGVAADNGVGANVAMLAYFASASHVAAP